MAQTRRMGMQHEWRSYQKRRGFRPSFIAHGDAERMAQLPGYNAVNVSGRGRDEAFREVGFSRSSFGSAEVGSGIRCSCSCHNRKPDCR
jgi:hypothetical protein